MATEEACPDAAALCELAVRTLYGRGTQRHITQSVRLFQRAAEDGSVEAWGHLARISVKHPTGAVVSDSDQQAALAAWRTRVDAGDADAQFYLGTCYEFGAGVQEDCEEAARLYRLSADQGDACAQCNLGGCYVNGKGVDLDFEKGVHFFKLSADQGSAKGQYRLGYCYKNGIGVQRDRYEAIRLLKLSADQGEARALSCLGTMYSKGRGIRRDAAEGIRLLRLGTDQGNHRALYTLGDCYLHGNGAPKDPAQAVRLYKAATEQGSVKGMFRLAQCYMAGTGIDCSPEKAVTLLQRSSTKGFGSAKALLPRALEARARLCWTIERHACLDTEVGRSRVAAVFLCHLRLSREWEIGKPALPTELWLMILGHLTLGDLELPPSLSFPGHPETASLID
eukprot:m.469422 g.469422  ORF g.469422 m.469422 type:complete len:395 (+) comp28515_c0_seq1:62-1246(+)